LAVGVLALKNAVQFAAICWAAAEPPAPELAADEADEVDEAAGLDDPLALVPLLPHAATPTLSAPAKMIRSDL
jgi:hypothetical protein